MSVAPVFNRWCGTGLPLTRTRVKGFQLAPASRLWRPVHRCGKRLRPKKIAVLTGTRAEYGLLVPVMEAIRDHPKLQLKLIVTGMHLLRKFGHTVDRIVADGWTLDARIRMQSGNDGALDQAEGLSRGVRSIARFLERERIDVIVVLGDRVEALAGALAGVAAGRIVAHIHGGDLAPGDFDDRFRFAITQLAHLHFPATRQSARRIIRCGVRPEAVHVVGSPGLDTLLPLRATCPPLLRGDSGGSDSDDAFLRDTAPKQAVVLQHPSGRAAKREGATMRHILRAVRDHDLHTVVFYPNSDRGHSGIAREAESACRHAKNGELRLLRSTDRETFLRTLLASDVLVGNSSSGILEAPFLGVPSVNIGPRQEGRQRGSRFIYDCDESYPAIYEVIGRALSQRPKIPARSCYGDGKTGKRIAKILAQHCV